MKKQSRKPDSLHCHLCGKEQPEQTYHCWYCHAALTDSKGRYRPECLREVELEPSCECGDGDCIECQ